MVQLYVRVRRDTQPSNTQSLKLLAELGMCTGISSICASHAESDDRGLHCVAAALSVLCPTQRQPLLGLIGHLAQLAPGYEPCSHATRSTATHRERGRRSGTRVQARLGSLRVSVCALLYVPQSTHIVSSHSWRPADIAVQYWRLLE